MQNSDNFQEQQKSSKVENIKLRKNQNYNSSNIEEEKINKLKKQENSPIQTQDKQTLIQETKTKLKGSKNMTKNNDHRPYINVQQEKNSKQPNHLQSPQSLINYALSPVQIIQNKQTSSIQLGGQEQNGILQKQIQNFQQGSISQTHIQLKKQSMFGSKKSDKYDIKMKLKKQNQLLSRVGDLANSVSGGASLFLGLDSPYHLTNQEKSLSNRNGISPRDIYQRSNTGSFNNNQQILSANQENLSNYQQIKSNFNTSRQINSIDDTPQNKISDNYTQYMEQNASNSNNINNPYNLPSSILNQIQPQISYQLQDLYQDQINVLKNNQYNSDTLINSSFSKKWWKNFQQKIYLLLNHTMSSKYAYFYQIFTLLIVFLDICILINESTLDGYGWFKGKNWIQQSLPITIFFLTEFLLKLLCYNAFDETLKAFFKKPLNVIDLATLLYVIFEYILFKMSIFLNPEYKVFRALIVLRLVRIFNFQHFKEGVIVLFNGLGDSLEALTILIFITIICIILMSSFMYFIEKEFGTESNREINNIPEAIWWAIITITTVGYGDTVPSSQATKFVSVVALFFGVLLLSLPVAIIGNKFQEQYIETQKQQKIKKRLQTQNNLKNVKSENNKMLYEMMEKMEYLDEINENLERILKQNQFLYRSMMRELESLLEKVDFDDENINQNKNKKQNKFGSEKVIQLIRHDQMIKQLDKENQKTQLSQQIKTQNQNQQKISAQLSPKTQNNNNFSKQIHSFSQYQQYHQQIQMQNTVNQLFSNNSPINNINIHLNQQDSKNNLKSNIQSVENSVSNLLEKKKYIDQVIYSNNQLIKQNIQNKNSGNLSQPESVENEKNNHSQTIKNIMSQELDINNNNKNMDNKNQSYEYDSDDQDQDADINLNFDNYFGFPNSLGDEVSSLNCKKQIFTNKFNSNDLQKPISEYNYQKNLNNTKK